MTQEEIDQRQANLIRLQARALSPVSIAHTWNVPNILVDIREENGFLIPTIREGGLKQIEYFNTTEYYAEAIDEAAQVFTIGPRNKVQFGGQLIEVLSDEKQLSNAILHATRPTASEYMALVGQRVMIAFSCVFDPHAQAYRVFRSHITLP